MSERMKKANKLVGQYQRLTGAVLSDLLQIVSEAEQEIERLRAEVKSLHLGREQDGQLLAEAQAEVDRLNTLLLKQLGGRGDDR